METSKFCFLVISLLVAAGHSTFALTEPQLRAIIRSELAVAAYNSGNSSSVDELTAKVETLQRSFGEFEAEARVYMQQYLLNLQETNSLCGGVSPKPIIVNPSFTPKNISWAEFDAVVGNKSVAQTGRSFNGSSLNTINPAVSRVGDGGKFTTVVFINHLDRAINNFQMYDRNNATFNPAPSSIAPHTKEVFTFAEPSCCFVRFAFSYNIVASNVSIASAMQISSDDWFALSFIPTSANMAEYYSSRTGIPGSSQNITQDDVDSPKLLVSYQNFHARLAVTATENNKVTVVIELADAPNSSILTGRFATPDLTIPATSGNDATAMGRLSQIALAAFRMQRSSG